MLLAVPRAVGGPLVVGGVVRPPAHERGDGVARGQRARDDAVHGFDDGHFHLVLAGELAGGGRTRVRAVRRAG